MNLDFMEVLRSDELTHVLRIISSLKSSLREPVKILEIDAGAGWQARCLSEVGYSVEAIDIAQSEYYGARVWPVRQYDGAHIPFPDQYFDIVYSSNVLEHIPQLSEFQKEMQRVLRPNGFALHLCRARRGGYGRM